MSLTTDIIYNTRNTCIMRTSDDFFPDEPRSHPFHLYANAMTSLFIGDLILPDWDMFVSGLSMVSTNSENEPVRTEGNRPPPKKSRDYVNRF